MKKTVIAASLLLISAAAFGQGKKNAETLKKEAFSKETVLDSIDYLKANLSNAETTADKRAVLHLTGTLQEQMGLYTDASGSYAKAAGIAAADARNMPKVTSEQLVLDAVRTSLCAGDWETADSYLNSAVANTKSEQISATASLYKIWSNLCKATSVEDTKDSIALLKAYSTMSNMTLVRPQVLLTLWYLTNDGAYSSALKKDYPNSPEAGIASGTVQIMSVPFWYFVPRETSAQADTKPLPAKSPETKKPGTAGTPKPEANAPYSRGKSAGKKQQLGMFSKKENADDCVNNARKLGFDAYYYTETKASGKTYYIAVVDENSTLTMGNKLKAAGIDCYTIE